MQNKKHYTNKKMQTQKKLKKISNISETVKKESKNLDHYLQKCKW